MCQNEETLNCLIVYHGSIDFTAKEAKYIEVLKYSNDAEVSTIPFVVIVLFSLSCV